MSTVTDADAAAEAAPIVACTISRDVQIFDLLIEDMEILLGETWGKPDRPSRRASTPREQSHGQHRDDRVVRPFQGG